MIRFQRLLRNKEAPMTEFVSKNATETDD